jgi:phage-related protein
MSKKIVRLTESELHQIINEAVSQIINENMEDEGFKDYLASLGRQGANKAQKIGQEVGERARGAYNNASNKVNGVVNNVKQSAKDAYNTASQKVQQATQTVKQGANDAYNAASDKVKGAVNNVVNGVKDMHNNAMQDSMVRNMDNSIADFENNLKSFLSHGGNFNNPQLNSRISGLKKMLDNYEQH